jgi:hypothetical protein
MDLRATILDVLRADASHALTFDSVVKGVAEKLAPEIRATLNDLFDKGQIDRQIGGRDQPWRYQARITRRL